MAPKFSATDTAQHIADNFINGNITDAAKMVLRLRQPNRDNVMFAMSYCLSDHSRNQLQAAINRQRIKVMSDRGAKDTNLYIAYRKYKQPHREASYVRELKPAKVNGKSRGDWGYVGDYKKAIPMTAYHLRRFQKDCKFMGDEAGYTVWRGE